MRSPVGNMKKTNPSDIINHPLTFLTQLGMLGTGIVEEFNWVYSFLGLIPFLFFLKCIGGKERVNGSYSDLVLLAVLLLILLNPPADRTSAGTGPGVLTASHTLISLMVGYGLTLIAAYMATHYLRFRSWGLMGGAVAIALAIYSFVNVIRTLISGWAQVRDCRLSSSLWAMLFLREISTRSRSTPVCC